MKFEGNHPHGYVYFLLDEHQRVKIGRSRNWPRVRKQSLQTGSADELKLVAVVPDGRRERKFHKRFRHLRIKNEWFHYAGPLRKYVEDQEWLKELRECAWLNALQSSESK